MRLCLRSLFALLVSAVVCPSLLLADEVRINEVQVIGTHNSYHIAPHESMLEVIRQFSPEQADAIQYTHPPLPEQLAQGIRQFELDVFADPKGGHYANPRGPQAVALKKLPPGPPHDPDGLLKQPGTKILHAPDVDFRTTALTLVAALRQVRDWSQAHPRHFPIMVMLEFKESSLGPGFTSPLPFDKANLDAVEAEILSVFDKPQILLPDDVRGDHATLRGAVLEQGWPTVEDARGKVIFTMDNGGAVRDRYLEDHPALEGRVMFVPVGPNHPAAAFMRLNDAVDQFDHIQQMVKQGFLVRTRANVGVDEARRKDTSRRDKALASGAHFISTDYPGWNPAESGYAVELPKSVVVHTNPVNGNAALAGEDLESAGR